MVYGIWYIGDQPAARQVCRGISYIFYICNPILSGHYPDLSSFLVEIVTTNVQAGASPVAPRRPGRPAGPAAAAASHVPYMNHT